jgi:uncharacterized repeat protein (TIGR03843 family)
VTPERALLEGDLHLQGRILPASNAAFLAEAVAGEQRVACIYKPVAGERPLWDFPQGTLAARERAAYLVSAALGWAIVPLTVLREGPHGRGMVQQWQGPVEPQAGHPTPEPVDVVPLGRTPPGYLHVLDAEDAYGHDVSLVHEDTEPLRRMALFDVVVNNADRKGGHVLAMADGHRYGVDHGVTFHMQDKLRTVLWGWAGSPVPHDEQCELRRLLDDDAVRTPLRAALAELLSPAEISALDERVRKLLRAGVMPGPGAGWPAIPWPPF